MQGKKLYRSVTDKKLSGVCGGLANYFGLDATIVRIIMVILACFSIGCVVYLLMWVLVPAEPEGVQAAQAGQPSQSPQDESVNLG